MNTTARRDKEGGRKSRDYEGKRFSESSGGCCLRHQLEFTMLVGVCFCIRVKNNQNLTRFFPDFFHKLLKVMFKVTLVYFFLLNFFLTSP